ncbi:Testis-expressed protein 264 [Takifugu flavidus]|uniref:Testis-expressed protein 264 n=1 Tax=Takifugu flavidus TaxID=433684 RepID=A0A5C6N4V9_9TELE|nr:Testis-expressed protein 264 [Takifugu flavidus]
MSDLILLLLVVVLLVCLIATVGFFLLYSGLLTDVLVKTGPPPIRNVTIAYKFKEGPYKECGAAFTESCSIGPKLSSIAVFYDDPKQFFPLFLEDWPVMSGVLGLEGMRVVIRTDWVGAAAHAARPEVDCLEHVKVEHLHRCESNHFYFCSSACALMFAPPSSRGRYNISMPLLDLKGLCVVSVPPQRPPEKCRYAVGSVLSEGEEKPDEELQKMYEKFGFKVFSLPEVSHTVTTAFPCTTSLSYALGAYRVYPKLASYIEVRSPFRQSCTGTLTTDPAPSDLPV